MSYVVPIYASWLDNILLGATMSGSTPDTSYSLDTFQDFNPSERVRFTATSITVTFTLTGSKQGGVLVIPMHNLTPGSTTVLNLSNAAGLSVNIPVPALESDGFPPTLAYDFSALANTTSGTWTITVTSNAANVIFGAAIMVYPKKTFSGITDHGSVLWDAKPSETRNMTESSNEYGSVYTQDYGTKNKTIEFTGVAQSAGIQSLLEWYRAAFGRVRPSLFWLNPDISTGASFGRMPKSFTVSPMTHNRMQWKVVFEEWPKGEVL